MNRPVQPELSVVGANVLNGLDPSKPDTHRPTADPYTGIPSVGELAAASEAQDAASEVERRHQELRSRLLTAAQLRTIPQPTPLVAGYLYRDSLAWLGGKPGHAKSFVAVDLACSVAAGQPWHGHDVAAGLVLYVIAEGASGLSLRVDAWSAANGCRVENMRFLPLPVQLLTNVDTAAFTRLVVDLQPNLVILDTQARVTVGAEENSSRDMGRFVDALEQLRRASGACVLVVHHEARGAENLRGSTALEGAATTILRCVKDGGAVAITNTKQKDAPEQPPLDLTLTPLGGSAILSHDPLGLAGAATESELALLAVLRDSFGTRGATKTELKEAANLPRSTYYRSINALVSKGLVHERKTGNRCTYTPAVDDPQDEIPTSPTESQDPTGKSPSPTTPIGVGHPGTTEPAGGETQ